MKLALRLLLSVAVGASAIQVRAQTPAESPQVHIVWMGGNDCPPCKFWRATELPKLQSSPEFKGIQFSYVTKTIESGVPPTMFLPAAVVPLKSRLDAASAGGPGSPQAAILVNGEVYDYFWGVRSAQEFETMLVAIRTGSHYPFRRCTQMKSTGRGCAVYE